VTISSLSISDEGSLLVALEDRFNSILVEQSGQLTTTNKHKNSVILVEVSEENPTEKEIEFGEKVKEVQHIWEQSRVFAVTTLSNVYQCTCDPPSILWRLLPPKERK